MTAFEMFKKAGFELYDETPTTLIYKYEEPKFIYTIFFDLELKKVSIIEAIWIDNDVGELVPMDKREPNLEYCAKYGYWQYGTGAEFDVDIHNAIHQQMKERGGYDEINYHTSISIHSWIYIEWGYYFFYSYSCRRD